MKPKYRLDIETGREKGEHYWLSAKTEKDAQQVLADLETGLHTGAPAAIVRFLGEEVVTTYINPSAALSWTIVWKDKGGVWKSVSLD
jgi:hypothetical protein